MNIKNKNRNDGIVTSQYHVESDGYSFSLIKFKDGLYSNPWEIYQIKGDNILEDVMRFDTKRDALNMIEHIIWSNKGNKFLRFIKRLLMWVKK